MLTDKERDIKRLAAADLLVGTGWHAAEFPPTHAGPYLVANVDLQAPRLTVDTCLYDLTRKVWVDWRGCIIDESTGRLPTHYKTWGTSTPVADTPQQNLPLFHEAAMCRFIADSLAKDIATMTQRQATYSLEPVPHIGSVPNILQGLIDALKHAQWAASAASDSLIGAPPGCEAILIENDTTTWNSKNVTLTHRGCG